MNPNKKILIIDDEIDLTQMIGFQFKAKGFEVQTAGDGLEALGIVHDFKPDLIILDMNMPRMGGIEFYSKICGTNGRPLYPVLVLTARANVQNMFKDLDIDGFMIKPFDIEELVREAETIIKKKSQIIAQKIIGPPKDTRRVCIVDDGKAFFNQISGIFLDADYTVIPARTGAMAIERMVKDVPDVALVHLGLADIAGDLVILRLSQMARTMEVKFILYTFRGRERNREVMERISQKKGIWTFVEYEDPQELLNAANRMF
jgi:DNA-binding response OmpR family regulator